MKTADEHALVPQPRVRVSEDETLIEVGQWYWVKNNEDATWLGAVTHVGSNYAKLEGPTRYGTHSLRVHFEDFETLCTFEPDPEAHLRRKVEEHQRRVDGLLNDIKQLTAGLGIVRLALGAPAAAASQQALVQVHGQRNVEEYKEALIKAKKETLPELFKKVKEEHEQMAVWMKAALIPLEAQTKGLRQHTEAINDRIFIVELYAGLVEQLVQLREGRPAENATQVTLFQRRHYMDEECLANYDAGGMDFRSIGEFDAWLLREDNLYRLLPKERCVVAFRVRRYEKEHDPVYSLSEWISLFYENEQNRKTFLYLRNGEQVYRLSTGIDFGDSLFPDTEHAQLEGKDLWVELDSSNRIKNVVTTATVEYAKECWKAKLKRYAKEKREHRKKHKEWEALSDEEKEKTHEPWLSHYFSDFDKRRFEPLTPESVYYDDGMKQLADDIQAHNRVATVLQGVLDRSPAFHPHPPWQLFTREGFEAGIELVYDVSRALTSGDPPDFEAYRRECNRSIREGSVTVGQHWEWMRHEAEKENERRNNDYRVRHHSNYKFFHPHGNSGPGLLARVVRVTKKGDCFFEWTRERRTHRYYRNDEVIRCRFKCPSSKLFHVDVYEPGDFKMFFSDPRTRVEYLQWAPYLLAAEDYHADKARTVKRDS